MKLSAKLLACLLCLGMLLCCASCANGESDTPEGMKNATAAGSDFRFYIPSYWNVSTDYGVSGGYYGTAGQAKASLVKYTLTAEQIAARNEAVSGGKSAISWFWESECYPTLVHYAKDGQIEHLADQDADVLLGSLNAKKYYCKVTYNGQGTLLHTVQTVGEGIDAFYVMTCTMADALYADRVADVDKMIQHFKLAEPYVPDGYLKATAKDTTAPDGMKLVSNEEVAYLFYVPESWAVNRNEAIFAAYLEGDRSSVSVVPYEPNVSMGVAEYFAMCEDMMRSTAGADGYCLLSTSEGTLGGKKATVYDYTYTVGGEIFRYRQVIAVHGNMIYSLTYTSRPEVFESHLGDVDMMIANFAFR